MKMHARMAMAALLLSASTAFASDSKDFRDWYAACDNRRDCVAFGFDSDSSGSAWLRLERSGLADTPAKIVIAVDAEDGVRLRLRFDDAALPGLPDEALAGDNGDDDDYRRLALTMDDALTASIRKAQKIIVTREDPPGAKSSDPKVSEISLSGAVAALLWIDEQQKRLGTVTAMIRRGSKGAAAVPAQPEAPVIVAAKPASDAAPTNHPAALIAKGRAACDDDKDSRLGEVHPLGGNRFLYAFNCPGSSGAYNFAHGFLIAPAGNAKAARTVSFRWPAGITHLINDEPEQTMLTNPAFDPQTMTLSAFSKDRGLGDCGAFEEWVWDGKTFRLALLKMMPNCVGIPLTDWPVLYRAERK
jgi:hypothetical protein